MQALGGVIHGTLPLLRRVDETVQTATDELDAINANPPLGAQIIRTARTFDRLVHHAGAGRPTPAARVMEEFKAGLHGDHLPEVVQALAAVLAEEAAHQVIQPGDVVVQMPRSQRLAAM